MRDQAGASHYASSKVAAQESYRKLAQARCSEALAKAAEITKKRSSRKLPPGVWWGFHWFWPAHLLEEKSAKSPMEDPEFLRRVFRLMNDERIVETFSIFDADASGTISAQELEGLIQMLMPNPLPTLVKEIAAELDRSPGEIAKKLEDLRNRLL